MSRKNLWIILGCFVLGTTYSHSQSIKRQSIGSFGVSGQYEEILIRQTVGQPYFTATYSHGSIGINPGFQQAFSLSYRREGMDQASMSLSIYPNPASSIIMFNPSNSIKNSLLTITDMGGRIIFMKRIPELKDYVIECEKWPDGLYRIHVADPDNDLNYSCKLIITK